MAPRQAVTGSLRISVSTFRPRADNTRSTVSSGWVGIKGTARRSAHSDWTKDRARSQNIKPVSMNSTITKLIVPVLNGF